MKKKSNPQFLWGVICNELTIKKVTWIMRLLILSFVLSIGLVNATNSYAQEARVSLKLDNAKIEKVLAAIENQSEFSFFINNKHVNMDRRINVNVKNKSIMDVLKTIFEGTDVQYSVLDHKIILSSSIKQQEKVSIKGSVIDINGDPIIGANIVVKGSANGTITDIDGKFDLLVNKNDILVVSYIGFLSIEEPVKGKSNFSFILKEDSQALEEIVVVGYGVQKKANLTGAVSSVSSKELASRPMSNLGQGIQGMVPNINITLPTNGNPGEGSSYNIRGVTSLSGGNPLILVDGVQMDPNMINPQDIETMSFLKDAAASSIYGSRAAYGVILITTKKGKNEAPRISYSNNIAFKSPVFLPKMQNSLEWAETINRGFTNLGNNPFVSNVWLQHIKDYMENPDTAPNWYADENGYANAGGGSFNYCGNVDYMDAVYKKSSLMQQHTLSIQGGSEKFNYYGSVGYNQQDGYLKYASDTYKRTNVKLNVSSKITDWLKVGVNTVVNFSSKENPSGVYWGSNPDGGGVNLSNSSSFWGGTWPVIPITHSGYAGVNDPNPSYNVSWTNPVQLQRESGTENRNISDYWLGANVDITPFESFKIHADYTTNIKNDADKKHVKKMMSQDPITGNWNSMVHSKNNWITMDQTKTDYKILNVTMDYSFKIQNNNNFKVLLGLNNESFHNTWFWARHMELINNDFPAMNQAVGAEKTNSSEYKWAINGYFGRINYNFNEKYFLELNARYDGSSRFPKNDKYGFFPSFSAGWLISSESFFEKATDVMNMLKARVSWGSLGNIPSSDQIGFYPYMPTLGTISQVAHVVNGSRSVGITPASLTTNMTWEKVKQWNAGVDFGFLKGKVTGSFDYYERSTFGMIGEGEPQPAILGTDVPLQNASDLKTKGFEFVLDWRDKIGKDFNYNVGLVLSSNSTEITAFNNPSGLLSTYYKGQKLGEIWGYQSDGVFQTDEEAAAYQEKIDMSQITGRTLKAGDVRYLDTNGDGKITPALTTSDIGDQSIIGNTNPDFHYGIKLGSEWKGFDLRIFMQGVASTDVDVSSYSDLSSQWTETYAYMNDTWTEDNRNAFWPRVTVGDSKTNTQTRTTGLQNAAYLRLKELSLGYWLPSKLINKISLQKVRVYFSGYNLYTITSLHKDLFDPEIRDLHAYPSSKSISFGIDIVL